MEEKKKKRKVFRQLKLHTHHGFLEDYLPSLKGIAGLAEYKVYTAIAMHANWDSGLSCPTQKTIMRITGIGSTRTVVKAVQNLADKGILSFERRKPRNKKGAQVGRKRYFYTLKHPARAEYLKPD